MNVFACPTLVAALALAQGAPPAPTTPAAPVATAAPAADKCETFSVEVFNPTGSNKGLALADICAQGAKVGGFEQSPASCL